MQREHRDQVSGGHPTVSEASAHPKTPVSNTCFSPHISAFLIGNAQRLKNIVNLRKQTKRYASNRNKIPACRNYVYSAAVPTSSTPEHALLTRFADQTSPSNPPSLVTLAISNRNTTEFKKSRKLNKIKHILMSNRNLTPVLRLTIRRSCGIQIYIFPFHISIFRGCPRYTFLPPLHSSMLFQEGYYA